MSTQVHPVGRTPERVAYYSAKFVAQVSQNLLLAALVVIAYSSGQQAIGLSGIFVAQLLPAAVLGLPGGALVDRLGARTGYVIGSALRVVPVFAAFFIIDAPAWAWSIAAGYSVASQVFTPAELAIIPAVQAEGSHRAHSILTALQFGGQGFGVLAVAPALYFIGGPEMMVFGSLTGFAAVTLTGVFLAVRLRGTAADVRVPSRRAFSPRDTVTFFREEPRAGYAVGLLGFKAMASKAMFIALPIYLERDVPHGNVGIAFVIVPGAIGIGVGLLLAGRLFARRSAQNLMRAAFLGIAGSALALAACDWGIERMIHFSRVRQVAIIEPTIEPTLWVAVPISFVIGFSFSLALVSARSVLSDTAPIGQQARIFAAQLWTTDTMLILPLLLAGIGTEAIGARPVLAVLGLLGVVVLLMLEMGKARRSEPETIPFPAIPGVQPAPDPRVSVL